MNNNRAKYPKLVDFALFVDYIIGMKANYTMHEKRSLASKMQKEPTKAEKALYIALSTVRIKFIKQHISCGYILDAYLPDSNVAVECDGGYHTTTKQQIYDIERDQALLKAGITVVRFSNEQVLENPIGIANSLRAKFKIPKVRKRTKSYKMSPDEKLRKIKQFANKNEDCFKNVSSSNFVKSNIFSVSGVQR